MKIQVNDVYVADNVSHGTQIIKKDCCEITLVHYDGYVEIITVDKDAKITEVRNEGEEGTGITIKKSEEEIEEENKQLKEEVKTLKETMIEVINSIYEEGQV